MSESRTVIAITAHYQEETEKLLKKLGFKQKCKWKNYGSKLTLWVLKKATPPKKKRK